MPSSSAGTFLRQLSGGGGGGRKGAWKSSSARWSCTTTANYDNYTSIVEGGGQRSLNQMEGLNNMYGGNYEINNGGGGLVMRKRVMVVVDQSSHSKHAMMWALTHVADKGDLLTLLHVVPPPLTYRGNSSERASSSSHSPFLASSLGSLCKASKPEVEVEALVIQGPKLETVMSQVKKLEVSVLVLGQKKPSPLINCLCGNDRSEEFVEQCINNVECFTIGVRKQSRGVGGYLISTRWQKNFWLLA